MPDGHPPGFPTRAEKRQAKRPMMVCPRCHNPLRRDPEETEEERLMRHQLSGNCRPLVLRAPAKPKRPQVMTTSTLSEGYLD